MTTKEQILELQSKIIAQRESLSRNPSINKIEIMTIWINELMKAQKKDELESKLEILLNL